MKIVLFFNIFFFLCDSILSNQQLKQRKVFYVHGTFNSCKDTSIYFPNEKYICIETGANFQSMIPIEEQSKKLCIQLKEIYIKTPSYINNGYYMMGFSQGGIIARHFLATCDYYIVRRLKRLYVFSSPNTGQDKVPQKDSIRYRKEQDNMNAYIKRGMLDHNNWINPFHFVFRKFSVFGAFSSLQLINRKKIKSKFIADLEENPLYKQRMLDLDFFGVIGYSGDNIVIPRKSAFFDCFDQFTNRFCNFKHSYFYKTNKMGMKVLYDTGRLGFFKLKGEHDDFTMAQLRDFDTLFVSDDCQLLRKYQTVQRDQKYQLCFLKKLIQADINPYFKFADSHPKLHKIIIHQRKYLMTKISNFIQLILQQIQYKNFIQVNYYSFKNLRNSQIQMIHIYFSTHSGTSEYFADYLYQQISDMQIECSIDNIKQLIPQKFEQQDNFIFLISTHFEGDCCDDARQFYDWLRNDEGYQFLHGKKYTMFGLGNKTYEFFNRCSKTCQKYFKQNKMEEFYNYDVGSNHDLQIEKDFMQWSKGLLSALQQMKNLKIKTKIDIQNIYKIQNQHHNNIAFNFQYSTLQQDLDQKKEMILIDVEYAYDQCTSEQSAYEIIFELQYINEYKTAQNIKIFPQNCNRDIQRALKYFNLTGEEMIGVCRNGSIKIPFKPGLMTKIQSVNLRNLKRDLFLHRLQNLCKKQQDIKDYIENQEQRENDKKNCIGILDLLERFKIQIKFEQFCEICPLMKPRLLTIASYCFPYFRDCRLLLKKETQIRDNKQIWIGLLSELIAESYSMNQVLSLKYEIQDSTFLIPKIKTDILMICTGTGIAPFIGILEEKMFKNNSSLGRLCLVYGCRDREKDCIKKDFLLKAKQRNVLNDLHIVESRKQKQKVYVQDFLKENINILNQYLQNDGKNIYICGNINMCESVIKIIEQDCSQNIEQLKQSKKLCIEAWN